MAIHWRGRLLRGKINRIHVYHNNSDNLVATFMKLSKKIHYFITEYIDVW